MIQITVEEQTGHRTLYAEEGSLLLSVLQQAGIRQEAPCGGRGTCGGCKVWIEGTGEVLACQYPLREDIRIRLQQKEEIQAVLTEKADGIKKNRETGLVGAAVDIGTTTLGFALCNLDTGDVLAQWGCENHQRAYGADVASRILACETKEGLECLKRLIWEDIKEGIEQLLNRTDIQPQQMKKMVITGNAVMLHILQGISPKTMGYAPFQVPKREAAVWQEHDCEILLYPHAGAFVGGDIIAGIDYLKMQEREEITLLIDLGTNGEMVLGNRHKLLATAAAAGPAFENCFRSSGTMGSKVLELLVLWARRKAIGKDGLLNLPYREKGIPLGQGHAIRQEQIREIQLAKGAIRAGIELLIREYGCQMTDISHIYLAGGFGFYLNQQAAYAIGLLPKEFEGRIEVMGNLSLKGGLNACMEKQKEETLNALAQKVRCLNLAELDGFEEIYLREISYIRK